MTAITKLQFRKARKQSKLPIYIQFTNARCLFRQGVPHVETQPFSHDRHNSAKAFNNLGNFPILDRLWCKFFV